MYGNKEKGLTLTAMGQLLTSWITYRQAQPACAAVSYNSNHHTHIAACFDMAVQEVTILIALHPVALHTQQHSELINKETNARVT